MTADLGSYDIVGIISRSPWFEGLPGKAQELLADAARLRAYDKGSYLFTTGEITSDVFCVLAGRVRLLITSAIGQQFAITDFEAESWINEPALAGDMPRMLDAQVIAKADALLISRDAVNAVGERYPQMYRNLFVEHVMRTRGVYVVLSGMAFYPLRARLAGRLLSLLEEHGQEGEDGVYLDVGLSQNDFAQLSLGSRQRINKILGEWRARGIIEIEANRYLVRNLEALIAETELRDTSEDPQSRG